jgi:prophage regulatory protein
MAEQLQQAPQILRLKQVIARTGLSRSSIYSFTKSGSFPAHVSLGARAVGWDSQAVDKWIQDRIKAGSKAVR